MGFYSGCAKSQTIHSPEHHFYNGREQRTLPTEKLHFSFHLNSQTCLQACGVETNQLIQLHWKMECDWN